MQRYVSPFTGYNQVVVLPKGAFNIKISQQSQTGDEEDDNYLGMYHTKYIFIGINKIIFVHSTHNSILHK